MTETVLIEESLKQELGTLSSDSFHILVLIKEVEKPELLLAFLEGLCKPYEKVAFFLYKDAIQLMDRDDCAELLARFIGMAEAGLKVFAANESLTTVCPGWLSCCSMRDLPLLIQEATKIISL